MTTNDVDNQVGERASKGVEEREVIEGTGRRQENYCGDDFKQFRPNLQRDHQKTKNSSRTGGDSIQFDFKSVA